MGYKALCGLTSTTSLISPPATVTIAYSAQGSFISWLSLGYARHVSALGIFPQIFTWLIPSHPSSHNYDTLYFLKGPHSDHPI